MVFFQTTFTFLQWGLFPDGVVNIISSVQSEEDGLICSILELSGHFGGNFGFIKGQGQKINHSFSSKFVCEENLIRQIFTVSNTEQLAKKLVKNDKTKRIELKVEEGMREPVSLKFGIQHTPEGSFFVDERLAEKIECYVLELKERKRKELLENDSDNFKKEQDYQDNSDWEDVNL